MLENQQSFLLEQISPEDWEAAPESIKRLVELLLESTPSTESENRSKGLEQQILENALKKESRYRQMIQAQTDLILRSLPDTTITFANDALCQALGQSLEEVIGQQWSCFVPVEDVEELHRKIASLSPTHPIFENINRDYRANNQIGWTQWINLGFFDDQGNLAEIQSVGRDITELQQQILREQALNRVFQAIRNSLDLEVVFATATAETARLLAPLNCFVVQYLPDVGIWRHVAEFHHDPAAPSVLSLEIPDAGNPFAAQLKQLQIVRVQDTETLEDTINQQVAQRIPGAWLLIPLVVEGNLWGSFTLSTHEHPFFWQAEQVELAQAVANQLEVAIQQANLYQQGQLELAERQRIAAALRETEARFQNMAANVPGAIFRYILRTDGTDGVLYMSPGCYRLWEVDAESVVENATVLWQMIHPEDLPGMQTSVIESARTLQPWLYAWRIITPSGREKWLEAAGRPTQQANGDVIWDTLILDVTDRKRAEQRLQMLATNMPGVIYQYVLYPDGSNAMLYVSPGCRELWELDAQEIEQDVEATWRMVHPDDLPAMRESVIESAQTLQPWYYEWRIIPPSGQQKWLQAQAKPQLQANGEIIWDGLILDVSDRKQVEEALEKSEQRFRHLFELTPKISVQGYDRDRRVIYWNDASVQLYGYSREEAMGRHLEELIIPPEMRQQVIEDINRWLTEGRAIPASELLLMHKDGSRIAVYSSHIMLTNPEGEQEMYCVDIDLSDRNQAEAELRESEARYRLLAENMNDLVCLHAIDGRYLYVSPSCETLLGYWYEEMLGLDPRAFIHPEDRDRVYQETYAVAREEKPTPITYRMRQKSGNYIWFETLIKPILDETGQIIQLQTTSRDVTERVQVQNQLQYDALHDALTGLPNRHLLMERLELVLNRTRRLRNYQFAVIFLDLDRFKVINDSLGHLAGDQLLIAIAQKLKATLRDTDLATRLGGDEFIILLEEIGDIQDTVRAVERIFAALQVPLMIEGREVYTTASAGIVLGSHHYEQASHLLRDADIAMYRAKLKGKARYEIFNTEMHIQALSRLHLENDLRRAIECQEFVLYYQPIITLETLQIAGFEALIRWQHPTEGLKSPGEFISIAEEIGVITALDAWGLQTACQQLVAWQTAFPDLPPLKISVNLSAQDLRHPNLLEELHRILVETQVEGSCLSLEITESMLIEDIESTIALLRQIKTWGIQISIDDFGTGYSSLSYLHRLPIDYLKVDRSFVGQIQTDPRNHQIVETIATLSQQLEFLAIAEGVETQAQLDRLRQLGYQFGQGYFFSAPLTQTAATTFLSNYRNR